MEKAQIPERALIKIQKALNLANSKSDEEAQTAMLLAQQMMAKYGLTEDEVNEQGEVVKKEVIEMYATKPTKLQWWQKELSSIIATNFRCFNFWRTSAGKSRILFLGVKEDTMIARQVFKYAEDSIEMFSIRYLNERGIEGISLRTKMRNDYIEGFLSGLRHKFREQVEKNDWGLILVKDDAVIEHYEKKKFKSDAGSSASFSGDSHAFSSGYDEGKRMDPNKKALKG